MLFDKSQSTYNVKSPDTKVLTGTAEPFTGGFGLAVFSLRALKPVEVA